MRQNGYMSRGVVAGCLFLAICGTAGTSGASAARDASANGRSLASSCPSPPKALNVAMVPTLSFSSTYYALALGYLQNAAHKFGLTANLITVGSLADSNADISSGAAQFEETIASQVMTANQAGQSFRVIAVVSPTVGGIVDATKNIKNVKELAGKTVAVTTLDTNSVITIEKAMEVAGGNPSSINFVATGSEPAEGTALSRGEVTAVGTGQPFGAQYVHEGLGHVLLDFYKPKLSNKIFKGPFASASIVTTTDLINSCPGLVKAVQKAYQKADRWVLKHAKDTKLALSKLPKTFATVAPYFKPVWKDIVTATASNNDTSKAALKTVVTTLETLKVVPTSYKLVPKQIVVPTILKKGKRS